jgi:hypothetical protein
MIVRIATEGQYELPQDQLARLNELDDAGAEAAESQSARKGELLEDAHLGPSDLILPPPDLSFAEAAQDFSGDALIPD